MCAPLDSLVSEDGLPETRGVRRPDVRARHGAIVDSLLVVGTGCKLFPAELEAFVEVTAVSRVVIAAQDRVVSLEVRGLRDVQLWSLHVDRSPCQRLYDAPATLGRLPPSSSREAERRIPWMLRELCRW